MREQLIGESYYADIQEQVHFEDAIVEQGHLAALRAWDKVEPGKKSTPFTKIIQGTREAFTDFFFTKMDLSSK